MHARAAGGGADDERTALGDRLLCCTADALARAGAERTAHEREIHHAKHYGNLAHLGSADHHRLRLARLGDCRLHLGLVRAGHVLEIQMIGVGHFTVELLERPLVRKKRNARTGLHATMVATLRADTCPVALREIFFAARAHDPQFLGLRNRRLLCFLLKPSHLMTPFKRLIIP